MGLVEREQKMANFFTDIIQTDRRYRTRQIVKDMDLLEPGFREKINRFMADALTEGTDLVPVETFRSRERQEQVFRDGKSQLRTVGTHHYGLAVDFAKRVNGKLTWEGPWSLMPRLASKHGLTSLYPNDAGHIQGCTVAQQRELFSGKWYPGTMSGVGSLAPVPVVVPQKVFSQIPDDIDPNGWLKKKRVDSNLARTALVASDAINEKYWQQWFSRSSQMAWMFIESRFDPKAFRREPIGVASYGLWQVLDSTATWLGHKDNPTDLFDPVVGSYYGMKYAAWGWNYLFGHLERPPTLIEWSEGYNVGYGAIIKGRKRPEYSKLWLEARKAFGFLDQI